MFHLAGVTLEVNFIIENEQSAEGGFSAKLLAIASAKAGGSVKHSSEQVHKVTMIDPKDGTIVGTIDLGGAPEQSASDSKGHLYVDIEDKNNIAVVDVKTMKVTAYYDLGEKGDGPAGLGLDAKNHILLAMCHSQNCVILNADDGKFLATLPIGNGTDGGGFNPKTMEAFSSQRDGMLTIIKEKSPTRFEVEQTCRPNQAAKLRRSTPRTM